MAGGKSDGSSDPEEGHDASLHQSKPSCALPTWRVGYSGHGLNAWLNKDSLNANWSTAGCLGGDTDKPEWFQFPSSLHSLRNWLLFYKQQKQTQKPLGERMLLMWENDLVKDRCCLLLSLLSPGSRKCQKTKGGRSPWEALCFGRILFSQERLTLGRLKKNSPIWSSNESFGVGFLQASWGLSCCLTVFVLICLSRVG